MTLVVLSVAVLASTATAWASGGFTDPVALPKTLPSDDQFQGGEPSMAFDPAGNGHLYAVAPGSDGSNGVGFWGSADDGATWPYARAIGSLAGGGDSDVEVGIDHTVYVLDLEVASSAVCRSHDFGKTFEDGCEQGDAQDHAGVEEDRQWLTHDPNDAKILYFNYHDFTAEYPILEKSTDGGSSFAPCGNLVDPSSSLFPGAAVNTVVGKTAVAKDGNIYVPIAAPTTQQAIVSASATPPYGQIVVAHHKGCNGDQFDNTVVYANDGGDWTNLFVFNAVGPDNTVYVLGSGKLNDKDGYNEYVWVSRDAAAHFSGPYKVNSPLLRTNVMGAIAPGNKPGQLAVAWYGAQNVAEPGDTKGEWRYYVATSEDYGKTWSQTTVTPNPFHYGDICTSGIACETGGNRNLLDFTSIAANPRTGCYSTVFPGDPFNTLAKEESGKRLPDAAAYISRQACAAQPARNTPGQPPQQAVKGVRADCHDRTAPVTAISRKHSRFTRRGISLRGIATDKGCGPGGRGQVARETLAISRRVGKRCQWLQPSGKFARTGSCRKKTYVTAKGGSKWSFRLKRHLKRGIYSVVAKAYDAVGNGERPVRGSRARARHNHNHYLFKVR